MSAFANHEVVIKNITRKKYIIGLFAAIKRNIITLVMKEFVHVHVLAGLRHPNKILEMPEFSRLF